VTAPHLEKRALERRLREAGASKAQAVAAVGRAWRRYGWLRRIAPGLLVRLAEREVGRG
jgi:hypothetical protein